MTVQKDFITRFLLAVFAFMVVDGVIWTLGFFATRSLYIDARYYSVWTHDMLSFIEGGRWSLTSLAGVEIWTALVGVIFVGGYVWLNRRLPGTPLQRGASYGLLAFLIGGLYQLLGMAMVVDLPAPIIASWIALSALVLVLQGAATGLIIKKGL